MRKPSSVAAIRVPRSASLDLVGLGQHDRIRDSGGVERAHRLVIAFFQPMPAVDQHEYAHQRRAATQIVARQFAP